MKFIIQVVSFESDHITISFKLSIDNDKIEKNFLKSNANLNFNNVNWKKFQKILTEKYNLNLPNNKNLNNTEIDQALSKIESHILNSITWGTDYPQDKKSKLN